MEGKCSFRSKEGKYTKFFFQINAESVDEVETDQVKFKLEEIAEEEEAQSQKSVESSWSFGIAPARAIESGNISKTGSGSG